MSEESIRLREIKPLDPWHVIETYFRDNPKYKSQHQTDSFNEFVYSKQNGIEYIIKRENPQILYKEPLESGGYRYQINIYYGSNIKSIHPNGTINQSIEDHNVFVSSPIEYVEGESKYMFPNIARLKGYTYASSILCNISVVIRDLTENKQDIAYFEKVNIGSIPIMVKSRLCVLRDLDSSRLVEVGECPYDQGGYFIIKGKEEVILSQEKKINNILYTNSFNDDIIPMQSSLTSVSKEGFQSSRTNSISLNRVIVPIQTMGATPLTDNKHVYRITARILGFNVTPADKVKIPLFVLFRALGLTSDKDIIQKIIYEDDEITLKNSLYELLGPTIKDGRPIYDQKSAFKFLALHTKEQETIHVIDLLNNKFMPNYKT